MPIQLSGPSGIGNEDTIVLEVSGLPEGASFCISYTLVSDVILSSSASGILGPFEATGETTRVEMQVPSVAKMPDPTLLITAFEKRDNSLVSTIRIKVV